MMKQTDDVIKWDDWAHSILAERRARNNGIICIWEERSVKMNWIRAIWVSFKWIKGIKIGLSAKKKTHTIKSCENCCVAYTGQKVFGSGCEIWDRVLLVSEGSIEVIDEDEVVKGS